MLRHIPFVCFFFFPSYDLAFVLMHTKVLYWSVEYMNASCTWSKNGKDYIILLQSKSVCTIQWPKCELLLGTYL